MNVVCVDNQAIFDEIIKPKLQQGNCNWSFSTVLLKNKHKSASSLRG